MKWKILLLPCLLCTLVASGQYGDYLGRSDINSVLIEDVTTFNIKSVEEAEEIRAYKALILNKESEELRDVVLYYDQFSQVVSFRMKISDLRGAELGVYNLNDLDDYGLISDLASDGRVKHVSAHKFKYPFVIEVEYALSHSGSLHYPRWIPQAEEQMEVTYSKLVIRDMSGNGVRYHPVGLSEPEIIESVGGWQYIWEVRDLAPYKFTNWNYNLADYTPYVLLAPHFFKMDTYAGKMDTWTSFGQWIRQLNADRASLDGLDLSELDERINHKMSDEEKTAVVYDYLQENTRYVSIQLGIGGWQPFSAEYVHNNKFGDCKALSNYTVALLGRYGVKAYYALINAGRYASEVPKDFPNAHFNHAIAVVPFADDTTFLECTSQTNPFGFSGTFTSNRNALLITEKGGVLIRTNEYKPAENLQTSTYHVKIDSVTKKSIEVSMVRKMKGITIEDGWFYRRYRESASENRKWFIDEHNFGAVQLNHFDLLPMAEEEVAKGGFSANFVKPVGMRQAGTKLLLDQSQFFDSDLASIRDDDTSRPIRIPYGYSQIDSLILDIPQGYFPRHEEPIDLETPFGHYSKKLYPADGRLLIVRKFQVNDGVYAPEIFPAFRQFVNQVVSNDRKRIVLVGET